MNKLLMNQIADHYSEKMEFGSDMLELMRVISQTYDYFEARLGARGDVAMGREEETSPGQTAAS